MPHAVPAAEALERRTLLAGQMVEDINARPWSPERAPAAPSEALSIGDVALFGHTGHATNVELFRTDGTGTGTVLVKDLRPGAEGSYPSGFVRAGSVAYFLADTGPGPRFGSPTSARLQLWRSDGTDAGTFRLADTNPGAAPDGVRLPTAVGDRLFFFADDGVNGVELWTSDGTAAGTRLVKDLAAGAGSTTPQVVGTQGTLLLFQSLGQLYASDGTDAGTVALGAVGAIGSPVVRSGDFAYFTDTPTRSLWRTDGTPAGTFKVVPNAFAGMTVTEMAAAGSAVFVRAQPTGGAVRLYRHDTAAAPAVAQVLVTNGNGRAPTFPTDLTAVGDTLYFVASDMGVNVGIFRVRAGATTATVVPGTGVIYPNPTRPTELTTAGNSLYYRTGGTQITRVPGPDAAATSSGLGNTTTDARDLAAFGDKVLFGAKDTAVDWELRITDGTSAGTRVVADVFPGTLSSNPGAFAPFGDRFLFSAGPAAPDSRDPMVTDGTAAGTYTLSDSSPFGRPVRNVVQFAQVSAERAVLATDGFDGAVDLWVTDGTVAGTRFVENVRQSGNFPPDRRVSNFVVAGPPGARYVMFQTIPTRFDKTLWRSDGTAEGTFELKDFPSVQFRANNQIGEMVAAADGSVVFVAEDANGWELWRSDGTPEGTRLLKNINAAPANRDGTAPADSHPRGLTRVGDHVYLVADDGVHGTEPWRTDGTEAGTVMVADVVPGPPASSFFDAAAPFVGYRGHVYFNLNSRLYRTDGTAAGTAPVAPPDTPDGFVPAGPLAVAGDRLYAGHWVTDGTPGGTRQHLFPWFDEMHSLTESNGRLFFVGRPPGAAHTELYTTDGTPGGLQRASGIGDGAASSAGAYFIGGKLPDGVLLVVGDDGTRGRELWRFDDVWGPRVVRAESLAATLTLSLSEPLAAAPVPADVVVRNMATGHALPAAAVEYDPAAMSLRVTFSGLPGGLPEGHYSASLGAGATDRAGNAADAGVPAHFAAGAPAAVVAGRHVVDAAAGGVAGASALRPGGAASSANVTGSGRGITAVAVDVAGLPYPTALSATDFDLHTGDGSTWAPAAAATGVTLTRGGGASATDRVTLTLPGPAFRNTWLRVTIKATANTGLAAPDVFYFGNLAGDTGGAGTPRVDAMDLARTRAAVGRTSSAALNTFDFNRDGAVNAADVLVVRNNQRRSLPLFTAPAAAGPAGRAAAAESGAVPTPSARPPVLPPRRGVLGAAAPARSILDGILDLDQPHRRQGA